MQLAIDRTRLERLFPAFLLVDGDGVLLDFGAAVARHWPDVRAGGRIGEWFRAIGHSGFDDLATLAENGGDLQLVPCAGGPGLRGSVIGGADGFVLALGIAPSTIGDDTDRLQISDFAPSDPVIQALMLVRLQKAMLEESQQIAHELTLARRRSQELLDRISRVAGYMAHDFNNFLSIIKLNGDRLLDAKSFGEAQRRMVRIIMEVADRGSEITRSLMTLSRQKHDSRTPLMLDHLIADNIAFFSTVAGARVEVISDLGAGGVAVDVSRTGLMNCIVNIIVNSRDAMRGHGAISITTRIKTVSLDGGPPREHVAIRISDTGPGMSAEVLSRAFEPLFSTKPHGSGIGLASLLEFAREMGGDACLDSAPGEGTSVFIYLPAGDAGGWLMPEAGSAPAQHDDQHLPQVLVVEDEPYALEALVEMIEALGYRALAAADASTAKAMLGGTPCDLLLTDVVLPGISGLELAAWAEEQQPGIKVVLMSGYVPETQDLRANWAFIRKPLDSALLRQLIVAKLGSHANSA